MTQWPYEKTEKRQAYEDYRAAGGPLDYFAWLAAGEPDATEEGASNSWLDSLAAFLQAQIDSRAISFDEAVLVGQDMEDRLFGLGKYEGERQTVIELPSWVRTDVENYRKSLPIQEQRRLDEEAKLREQQIQTAQQQAQDIASQRTQLPLGAGGTIQQQIQAGELARRNLQLQFSSAPDYMQDTIRGQIEELGKGISQLQETDLLMAKERAIKMGWDTEPGPLTRYGSFTKEIAEKYAMSPEATRRTGMMYQSNPERGEYANLTDEEKRDLTAVAEEAGGIASEDEYPTPKIIKPFEDIPGFGELGVTGSPTWKRWFEQRYPTIVSQFKGKEAGERTEAGWAGFLETERARIKAEFTKQSPYSRGESPGEFQPRIKTVAW